MQCHVAQFSGLRRHPSFIDNELSHLIKDSGGGGLIGWQWCKPFDDVMMTGLINIAPSLALTHHVEITSELSSFRHHIISPEPLLLSSIAS